MATVDPIDDQGYNPNVYKPNGGVSGYGTPQTPGTTAPTPQPDMRTGIAAAYKKYLGRDIKDYEYGFWDGNSNYEAGISGSAEARARATGTAQGRTTPPPGFDADKWNDPAHQTDKYTAGRIGAGGGSIDMILQALNANGQRYTRTSDDTIKDQLGDIYDIVYDYDNATGQRRPQWTLVGGPTWDRDRQASGGAGGANGAGGAGGASGFPGTAGSAFSDPATAQWEQLVRAMAQRLLTPTPDSARELQQTQSLDPMERQRQADKQRQMLQLSQRGIPQDSGIWRDAMDAIDRNYSQLRTRTQASFAHQWAQDEESRAANAVNLFGQIPQYQDTRLKLAQGTMEPSNTASLLQMLQQNNQFNNAQSQAFWENMTNAIVDAFKKK